MAGRFIQPHPDYDIFDYFANERPEEYHQKMQVGLFEKINKLEKQVGKLMEYHKTGIRATLE